MKNKKIIVIFACVFVACFMSVSIFFSLQSISAHDKKMEYFDFYKSMAEEYIKSLSEICDKYGDDVEVDFDNTLSYSESGERGIFDRYIELFVPKVPATLEEFNAGIEMITFKAEINRDDYEIVFKKNESGELVVSSLSLLSE